jgi:diadenosine tetraphosphatase ApaH/serine/threonine PP2A family protein phosphatase
MVCGHTHHAAVYSKEFGFGHAETESEFTLPHDSLCLINPGAVGQSRDGKSMARYAVLDMETRQAGFFGVRYDHAATIDKLRRAGLVPLIDLQRPVGLARYAEAARKRWARFRYKSNPAIS